MARKLLTMADVPIIEYTCPCGGPAQACRFALLCENCLHGCRSDPPKTGYKDPQEEIRAQIQYAKFRRRHKRCFDCKFIKAVFMDVECTNKTMKKKVPKGGK